MAHLEIAETALRQCSLDGVDVVVSRVALAKEDVERPRLEDRVAVLRTAAARRPWLGLVVTDEQLIADVAAGYDVVIMGADKWAQVCDPAFYGGSSEACAAAVARLPEVALVPRPPFEVPDGVTVLDVTHEASSTAVRDGRHDWMAPEAAEFDARTGAWTDPARYDRWLAAGPNSVL